MAGNRDSAPVGRVAVELATSDPAPLVLDPASWRGRALAPVLVYSGLMVALISSLGAPMVPSIATDYRVSLASAQWSLTIALLVGTVTLPVIGRLGDGPRRAEVLRAALAAVAVGSVLAALPLGFAFLLIGRGLQGIGLAMVPLAMSVARDHMELVRARATVSTLSVTGLVGLALGYPATALIAEHVGLHAAFWFGAVIASVATGLSIFVVPTSAHRSARSFDLAGAILLSLGLAGLVLYVSEGELWGWASLRLAVIGLLSLVILLGWGWYESRVIGPLLDLRLLRHRIVLVASINALLAGIGSYMLLSMIIRYVQAPKQGGYGLGESVVVAGLILIPMSVAGLGSSQAVNFLTRWMRPERILPLSSLLFAITMVMFATGRSHLWQIFIQMGVAGLAVGWSFAVLPRLIVNAVPSNETSSALALNQLLKTLGSAVGSALSATILAGHTVHATGLPTSNGYTEAAYISIAMFIFAGVVSWILTSRRAAFVSSPRASELLVEARAR